jgi:tRNA 2-thiouridine synthesizing protein D
MKYAIQVHSGPFESQAAHTAYQFIKAALDEGHEIVRAFFYHDGVCQGFCPAGAGPDWSSLTQDFGLDLVLCISAAERRGLADAEGRLGGGRLAAGFRIGGLGQWMDACLKADRVLVFGD